jgi:zinc protease
MKYKFLSLLLFVSISLAAQNKYPDIDIPFKKFVLSNGLTLIINEDHKLPIASFNIWYHVGSKNEKSGKTGFAHLFEHIMFTSTEHWGNFDEVMQTVGGGNNNGTTNNDRTNYFETFTSTGLDRVLWLESDRMGFLLKGLDSVKVNVQRGVVQNEKRQSENQPYAVGYELTTKATYPVGHPYSWTVIGSMDDLSAASIDDVKEWFRTYYGPNNAIIAIAGDVKAEEVLEKVKKYFGDIPASPPIARFTKNIAKMKGITFQQVQDRVPQARLQKVWNIPGWGSAEATQLSLLGDILTNGKSSRLYKRLVLDEELASNVYAYTSDNEIGGQFFLVTEAKPGVSLSKINDIINLELKKVFTTGVTVAEVERTKSNYFVQFLKGIETIGGFGSKNDILALGETFAGSPDAYKKILGYIRSAIPADIKKVSIDWLTDGEYVLEILPYGNFESTDSKLDRRVMPAVPNPPAAKFPAIKNFTLSNGLKVYLVEKHELPLISMVTAFNAGFSADKAANTGIAKLTGNMMTEGTSTKSSTQISDELNALGTSLSSSANLDNSFVNMSCLKTNLDASMALFTDVLLHPSFPQKEFDRVKKEQLLAIEQEKVSPWNISSRILPSLLYPKDHPYNIPTTGSGTKQSLEKTGRNDLVSFHDTWFVPNNGFTVVVGDITETELKAKLEKGLAGWKSKAVPKNELAAAAIASSVSVYIIDKPGAGQSQITAAEIAPSAMEKGYDEFSLMNNILGGTFLSRLNMNLREDKHWSYGAGSGINPVKGPGIFSASAGVQTDKTKESIQEFVKELTQINSTKPIAPDEFTKEQTSVILSIPSDWQTNNGIMWFLYNCVAFNRGPDYPSNYSNIIQNLKLADIQNSAAKIVKPQNLTWLIVGDRQKIEAGIRELNLGPVKILDADGKEIK